VPISMIEKIRILQFEKFLSDYELIHSLIESGELVYEYFITDNEKDLLKIPKNENQ